MTIPPNNSHRLTAADVLARYNEELFPDFCDPLTDVNQVGTFGNRPIHMASHHGNMEEIEALVEGGANVNAAGEKGSTPLHEAASKGHVEAVKFLLGHGAYSNVRNEFGRTPLDVAELNGHAEVVKLLRSKENHE
jgi:ankyrin repeat protein